MIWKESISYPDYEVSEFGDVRRSRPGKQAIVTGKCLKPGISRLGYLRYGLCRNGKVSTILRGKLVADTFLGQKPFESAVVCHNDGNKTNDHFKNLRWDTQKSNHADMILHGTKLVGSQKPQAILIEENVSEIRRRVAAGEVKCRIAESFRIHPSTISDILAGRTWAHVA